jgi:hypothetical protein
MGPPISPEPAPRQFEREEIVARPTIARERKKDGKLRLGYAGMGRYEGRSA